MVLQIDTSNFEWAAPYALSILLIGFAFFFFRIFENWYADTKDKPLYTNLFVFRKLTPSQVEILKTHFSFYGKLTIKQQKQFQHRVATFITEKQFVGREELQVTEKMKILIAAVGVMLSFGRKNYTYSLINTILIFPNQFYSNSNEAFHKGEFNPKEKTLVFSWKDFEAGYAIEDDNLNLGIHEFMHAMHIEAKVSNDIDASRFLKQFNEILKRLNDKELKKLLDETRFFRDYAFTNQYEFMAVLAEYFMESPTELKKTFPKVYDLVQTSLNMRVAGY
ncbi:hypothetical protein ULMS_25240 [Patiriisocius marinistellae]|uniref:Zinc-dependent peptidase n=2 Tax=Patiriisocius marinistellae TaxID=2494560 RepID=A0A5J4G2P8_9FLAO|nr:hypothetical protein ULMS_25240 [Patiriisocius marinistellae]